MKPPSARRPVFLDSTGLRRRAIRRIGVFLAVPIVGYLILMSSSLLGGPRLDTPLVPLPEAANGPRQRPHITPAPAAIQTNESEPSPAGATEPTGSPGDDGTTAPPTTPGATTTPTAPTVGPTVVPTIVTTAIPTTTPPSTIPSGTPTSTPTSGNNGKKPTTPPGHTKTPSRP